MPFNLSPNPTLYNNLFAQWEREDLLRQQQEASSTSFLLSRRNQFFLLLFVLLAITQITLLMLQRCLTSVRAVRRQLYLRGGRDEEDGKITPSGRWEVDGDVKAPDGKE